jgi:hypothetical protein
MYQLIYILAEPLSRMSQTTKLPLDEKDKKIKIEKIINHNE